jgi:TRAP-type C4-dicarboxylate transport system permease small subunit
MGPLKTNGTAPDRGRSAYAKTRGLLGWVEKLLLDFSALAIGFFCIYICTGILLRYFLGSQVPDEVVIVGELMVAALILPLGFVAADRGFIAVELLTNAMPMAVQRWLNVLAVLVGLLATLPITYAAWHAAETALTSGNYFFGLLSLPEWPGRIAFFCGYIVFVARLLDLLIHDTLAAFGVIAPDPQQHDLTKDLD